MRIEDYGLIGDTQSAALVGIDGSIDWLCLPRFDSPACFASLLGTAKHGRWLLAPVGVERATRRRYRPDTLILETEFDTGSGSVRLTDCMPPRSEEPDLIRVVECTSGRVEMHMTLRIRFDYGSSVPWRRRFDYGDEFISGPFALTLYTDVPLEEDRDEVSARFTLSEGQRAEFVLAYHESHRERPPRRDATREIEHTEQFWREWMSHCTYDNRWNDLVRRSLITLKAMTHAPTGGLVAAPTTSLPEKIGGVRNWDYRYCWLRDATFSLYALMESGFLQEAKEWRNWMLRALAGDPHDAQMLYGPAGERRLWEIEIDWLPGYENSSPVRIGNAVTRQFQLDVWGEVMDALHVARRNGIETHDEAWLVQRTLMEFLERNWSEPDEGIWEVRGERRQFTHSKVMAWVAADRAVKAVDQFGLDGPVERWRALASEIHDEVLREGYNPERRSFTQFYGSERVDASLLMIPLVGFLPADDERMLGTVRAIEQELCQGDFVWRYHHDAEITQVDGLPPGEGAFLPCSFWLADNYAMVGRTDDAVRIMQTMCDISNDLGLLSEEYDPEHKRLVGNFPQAFSHESLINTAHNLTQAFHPAEDRADRSGANV